MFRRDLCRDFAGATLGLLLTLGAAQAQTPYQWKPVPILGGGLVSGLVFHSSQKDLLYARTDVGGAYRWNASNSSWLPLTDGTSRADSQLMGVLSLALDARDGNRVYMATGSYTASWGHTAALLRSSDKGASWARTDLPFRLGGNEDGRTTGERLQVDPNLGSVLFLGSNRDGLWKSSDRGLSWSRVTAFTPTSTTFVLFDPASGSAGSATRTIFVGVNDKAGANLYRSSDGGKSWSAVTGQPLGLIPHQAALDGAGALYLTYSNALGPNGITNGAVWKLTLASGVWKRISPVVPGAAGSWDSFGYAGLSVDRRRPGTLVVSTLDRWAAGDDIFRSTDGGNSWRSLGAKAQVSASNAPWVSFGKPLTLSHWMGDVEIDPSDSNRIWNISGVGVWRSTNLLQADSNLATSWTFPNNGLEETVVFELASPPAGASLLSALWDIDGFRHSSLSASPAEGMYEPAHGHGPWVAFAEAQPQIVVRTSVGAPKRGLRSTDGGQSWTEFAGAPAAATANVPGKIAINASGSHLLWAPDKSQVHVSDDDGASWRVPSGVPAANSGNQIPVADRVDANRMYLYDPAGGRVYVSYSAGATFGAGAAVPTWGGILRAVPGIAYRLWLPTPAALMVSSNGGWNFSALPGVDAAWAVGFGKAASGQSHPAAYLWGKVKGVEGLFRSIDGGQSWVRINDDKKRFGWITSITGDPRVYGRVYVGTGGRGILMGNP